MRPENYYKAEKNAMKPNGGRKGRSEGCMAQKYSLLFRSGQSLGEKKYFSNGYNLLSVP